jgi:amino acid transporter
VVGMWGLVAAIVNITIGGGIFRLPGIAAATIGAAAPISYAICAVAMGLVVLCFADAGSRVSLTGGVYAYVEVAFGPFIGFLCGVLLWAGLTAALSAVTTFFADAIGALVPALASRSASYSAALCIVAMFAALNVRGVRAANRFNAVMTLVKLAPLALFVVAGASSVHGANLVPAAAPSIAGLTRASTVLIFAFLGVEGALVPSGEVRDPARTVPRAVLIAIGIVAVFYIGIQLVSQGILGASLAGQKNPIAEAAGAAFGAWGRTLILVGSMLSMFSYLSGMTLAVPRMLFAFSRDGFLPRRLAEVHPRFRTPHVAIVAQTVIVALLAVFSKFEWLAVVGTGTVLLVYIACCLASVELRRRGVRADGAPFAYPGSRVVPWLALAVIVGLLSTLKLEEWMAVLATLAFAVVVYFIARLRRRSAIVAEEARA